jgi:2-phospho-L-lactate guanylyltransferase
VHDDGPVPGWVVLIPVKDLMRAKSRLPGPARARGSVALAMARDTVSAAARCPLVGRVVVVTNDPVVAAAVGPWASVTPDRPRAGLSAAVEDAAARVGPSGHGRGVAVLTADLPALRAAELGRVLCAAASTPRSFVADAAGTGTVLLAATGTAALRPAFQGASRAAHAGSGAVELTWLAGPGLRHDVDTLDDLVTALDLVRGRSTDGAYGSGWRTAAAAARTGWTRAGGAASV